MLKKLMQLVIALVCIASSPGSRSTEENGGAEKAGAEKSGLPPRLLFRASRAWGQGYGVYNIIVRTCMCHVVMSLM